ncbi:MAG: CDP-glycerol glycerophosphotransferase family protein [Clostridium sp.]
MCKSNNLGELKYNRIEARVEQSKIEDDKLIIRGYCFVRGIECKELNQIRRQVIIKSRSSMIEKTIECISDYRTDLTHIFKEDGLIYQWGGYKDIIIDLKILGTDIYDIYMDLKINNQCYRVNFKYMLAETRNSLKLIYLKDKEISFGFSEGTNLYVNIRELNIMGKFKSMIRHKRRDLRFNLGLLRRKQYKSFVLVYMYKVFNRYLRKKEIWLMGERADTAQDNTFHVFKYVYQDRKDINAYYVIDKSSNDIKRLKNMKKIIKFGSLKHTLYLLSCKYSINSYYEKPNMYTKEYKDITKYYPEFKKNKKIFLQHGVIGVSRVNHVLHKNRTNYDMFITSSKFEKEHIVNEFGYKDVEVAITGLARWDNLIKNNEENKILLMPTWRNWIKSEEELLNSEYIKSYFNLLKSSELLNILNNYNYELIFYPHYQIQKLINSYGMEFDERIKIIKKGECTVQELINQSKVLITDYSTVAFDFAYKKTPVVFYQFDYDQFYSRHYAEGPINHKEELFGLVTDDESILINELKYILDNKCEMKNEYIDKSNKFIECRYDKHCETIVKVIEKIKL